MSTRSTHVVALRWNPPPATGVQTIYTVPADRTLILRDVRARFETGTGTLTVFVQTASGSGVVVLGTAAPGGAITLGPDAIWLVLQEGDLIRASRSVADGVTDFWLSGSLLQGDPS